MSKKVLFEGDGIKFSIEHYENRYGIEIANDTPSENGIIAKGIYFDEQEMYDIIEQIEEFMYTIYLTEKAKISE